MKITGWLLVFSVFIAGCDHYTDSSGMTRAGIRIIRESAKRCQTPMSYSAQFAACINLHLSEKTGETIQYPLRLAEDSWGNLMVLDKSEACAHHENACLPYSKGENGRDDCGEMDDLVLSCD